jgi:hypothetical protein
MADGQNYCIKLERIAQPEIEGGVDLYLYSRSGLSFSFLG